jgi:hypothetical protein
MNTANSTPEVHINGLKILVLSALPPGLGLGIYDLNMVLASLKDSISKAIGNQIMAGKHVEPAAVYCHEPGVKRDELLAAIARENPHIVHFLCHGSSDKGDLHLEATNGSGWMLNHELMTKQLALLSSTPKLNLKCLVFSACHAISRANDAASKFPYAIGMNDEITDVNAAKLFSLFYYNLIMGFDIAGAFDAAKLSLEDTPAKDVPQLVCEAKTPLIYFDLETRLAAQPVKPSLLLTELFENYPLLREQLATKIAAKRSTRAVAEQFQTQFNKYISGDNVDLWTFNPSLVDGARDALIQYTCLNASLDQLRDALDKAKRPDLIKFLEELK